MSTLLVLFGLMFMIIAIATMVGLTLYDIREIRLDDQAQRHPYARAFRSRPLVSVLVEDHATEACLRSIRESDYRKTEIIFPGEEARGKLWMALPSDVVICRTAISTAVRRFNTDPTLGFVELTAVVQPPKTLRQLFRAFRLVAQAPFISVRTAFRITPGRTPRPLIYKPDTLLRRWPTRVYQLAHWVIAVINVVALLYIAYVAVVLGQSALLLDYTAGFCLWLVWSIWQYPFFSLQQRISYTLLAPVSFCYFIFVSLRAPLICHVHRFRDDPFSQPWQAFARRGA
jgi:hypothetical protein